MTTDSEDDLSSAQRVSSFSTRVFVTWPPRFLFLVLLINEETEGASVVLTPGYGEDADFARNRGFATVFVAFAAAAATAAAASCC